MASMKAKVLGVGKLVDGQEKKWMGCFLDVLRTFGINADQWTTAAQVEWERRRTAEQGAERFMPKGITAYYRFLFWMESTFAPGWCFLLRDYWLDFDIRFCENPINQSIQTR